MRELTIKQAETLVNCRLDRRRKYATTDDGKPDEDTGAVLFGIEKFTRPCSGCSCDGEYPCGCCSERGYGCEECGFTGKRRQVWWAPLSEKEYKAKSRRKNTPAAEGGG